MADTTAIAIVGIAVSGGVGVLAPALTSRAARARLRIRLLHERSMSDVAELREVLGRGAEAIRRAMWASAAIVDFLRQHPRFIASPSLRRQAEAELRRRIEDADRMAKDAAVVGGDIALRLGRDHKVYRRYDEAMDAYVETLGNAMPLLREPWRWLLLRSRQESSLDAVFEAGESKFRVLRREYIAAAQAVVGSRLE